MNPDSLPSYDDAEKQPRRVVAWVSPWSIDPPVPLPVPKGFKPQKIRPPKPEPARVAEPKQLQPRPAITPVSRLPDRQVNDPRPAAPPPSINPEHLAHQRIRAQALREQRLATLRLFGVALLLLLLVIVAFAYIRDTDPPSDQDLTPEPPLANDITPRAPSLLALALDNAVSVTDPSLLNSPPSSWDTPSLNTLVQQNAVALENLKDLISDENWQPRHPEWRATNLAEHPNWPALTLAKKAAIASYSRSGGDRLSAVNSALGQMTFGRRLQDVSCWTRFYALGLLQQREGTEMMADLLRSPELSPSSLQQAQMAFERVKPSAAILKSALPAFYQFERRSIVGLRADDPWDNIASPFGQSIQHPLLFKRHETLELMARGFREMITAIGSPVAARVNHLSSIVGNREAAIPLWTPNLSGMDHARTRLWAYSDVMDEQALQETRHLLVLTLFAVRRFGMERGHAPTTLDALVPAYFSSVPIDPYSGRPFIYDAAKGILSSVGRDFQSIGGHPTEPPLLDDMEPTVSIQ
jgi:hypothetical protein